MSSASFATLWVSGLGRGVGDPALLLHLDRLVGWGEGNRIDRFAVLVGIDLQRNNKSLCNSLWRRRWLSSHLEEEEEASVSQEWQLRRPLI